MSNEEIVDINFQATKIAKRVKEADNILAEAKSFKVETSVDYADTAEILKRIKAGQKVLNADRKDITKPMDEAKDKIMALFKKPLDVLLKAEDVLKQAMLKFLKAEEKKREDEQTKREEKAKKLEDKADVASEAGKDTKSDSLNQQAAAARTVPLPEKTKVAGIAPKKRYFAVVTDKAKIPYVYMEPNMSMLNKWASATKGVVDLPGIRVESKDDISAGSR